MRIALIDNLSARGYRLVPPPNGSTIESMTPTALSSAAVRGYCDAALVPSVWAERLLDFEPAGGYGIACRGPVRSVMLFSNAPADVVIQAGLPIHVTPSSQTSVRLLGVLANATLGRAPVFVSDPSCAAGTLLIGDEAVDAAIANRWPHQRDLCGWWTETTGLPFVFARWMVRKDLAAAEKQRVRGWLESCACAAESSAGRAQLARTWEGPANWRLHAHAYYEQLRLRLGDAEIRGLREFLLALEEPTPWCKSA